MLKKSLKKNIDSLYNYSVWKDTSFSYRICLNIMILFSSQNLKTEDESEEQAVAYIKCPKGKNKWKWNLEREHIAPETTESL